MSDAVLCMRMHWTESLTSERACQRPLGHHGPCGPEPVPEPVDVVRQIGGPPCCFQGCNRPPGHDGGCTVPISQLPRVVAKPTVGRIVHYWPIENARNPPLFDQPLAALVTSVSSLGAMTVALTLFWPGDSPNARIGYVEYSETPAPGHWSWPPREP